MTLKEIYQALADGKSIRHETWDKRRRICVGTYGLTFETGEHYNNDFLTPGCWEIYEESRDLETLIERITTDIGHNLDDQSIASDIAQLVDLKIKKSQLK